MTDANGMKRRVRTILFARLADNPEQQMIACCSGDASFVSIARHPQLGSGQKQPRRTGIGTLDKIKALRSKVDPHNLCSYTNTARSMGLSGVHKPYWRNWKFADPSKFLAPDALHQWHKFFWVHMMGWARELIGDAELDRRYMALQKHVQYRHFREGFTKFLQHTCREARDLEASFIAVISDHPSISPGIMKCFRSLLDFIYIAQFDTHTTTTLKDLKACLSTFHANKHHLIEAGLRNGEKQKGEFNIRKLETMLFVPDFILSLGTCPQFNTEPTEKQHIPDAKEPYRKSNKKNVAPQVCLHLDRREKIELFAMYIEWKKSKAAKPTLSKDPKATLAANRVYGLNEGASEGRRNCRGGNRRDTDCEGGDRGKQEHGYFGHERQRQYLEDRGRKDSDKQGQGCGCGEGCVTTKEH